jgi:hypothetical protein
MVQIVVQNPKLEKLVIRCVSNKMIAAIANLKNLRYLALHVLESEELMDISSIASIGPQLEYLCIHSFFLGIGTVLKHCTQLKMLSTPSLGSFSTNLPFAYFLRRIA